MAGNDKPPGCGGGPVARPRELGEKGCDRHPGSGGDFGRLRAYLNETSSSIRCRLAQHGLDLP